MKTQTQHTPDTWHVASTGNHQGLIISDGDGRNVAVAYDKADAPLIGAAPELFQALLDCVPDLEHYVRTHGPGPDKRLDAARAAIAKAEGRAQ